MNLSDLQNVYLKSVIAWKGFGMIRTTPYIDWLKNASHVVLQDGTEVFRYITKHDPRTKYKIVKKPDGAIYSGSITRQYIHDFFGDRVYHNRSVVRINPNTGETIQFMSGREPLPVSPEDAAKRLILENKEMESIKYFCDSKASQAQAAYGQSLIKTKGQSLKAAKEISTANTKAVIDNMNEYLRFDEETKKEFAKLITKHNDVVDILCSKTDFLGERFFSNDDIFSVFYSCGEKIDQHPEEVTNIIKNILKDERKLGIIEDSDRKGGALANFIKNGLQELLQK